MKSAWIYEYSPSKEFDELLRLYTAFSTGKTSNPDKLRFLINKMWDSFDIVKKKDFTARLVSAGVLGERNNKGIDIFGGTITELIV